MIESSDNNINLGVFKNPNKHDENFMKSTYGEAKKFHKDRKKFLAILCIVLLLCLSIIACTIYLFSKAFSLHDRIRAVEQKRMGVKGSKHLTTVINKTTATTSDPNKHDKNFMESIYDFIGCVHNCVNGRCSHENDSYVCLCDPGYSGIHCTENVIYSDCEDVFRAGFTRSGIYYITIPGRSVPLPIYCDMDTDGGKWMIFQRRMDGSVDFYLGWSDYQFGFGRLDGEFWLGLEYLHSITSLRSYQLRVDLEDWNGSTPHASYKNFSIGDLRSNYVIHVGGYNGTAGDSLSGHNNQQFSTKDRDHDKASSNCATAYKGAWWYNTCYDSNLNGRYYQQGSTINNKGVCWYRWRNNTFSFKRAEMKIKLS